MLFNIFLFMSSVFMSIDFLQYQILWFVNVIMCEFYYIVGYFVCMHGLYFLYLWVRKKRIRRIVKSKSRSRENVHSNNRGKKKKEDKNKCDKGKSTLKIKVLIASYRLSINQLRTHWCFWVLHGSAYSSWYPSRQCLLIRSSNSVKIREKPEKEDKEHRVSKQIQRERSKIIANKAEQPSIRFNKNKQGSSVDSI